MRDKFEFWIESDGENFQINVAKQLIQISRHSLPNKRVALVKNAKIDNSRATTAG